MNVMSKPQAFTLPPLPFDESALAPVISAETMRFHYGKHHKAYVDKLNDLVAGTDYALLSLDEVVKRSHRDPAAKKIFNNAAQDWNHTFFWKCLTPNGGGPRTRLHEAIDRELGGHEKFKKDFIAAGVDHFGSGWVWLVVNKGKLAIETGHDAMTPMAEDRICLLTADVWEHAYYLDYQNRRPDFLTAVFENLLNWKFADENYARAMKGV
jgi:Fe-Mn family superoxide dismutase